jgi:hypothetical protein
VNVCIQLSVDRGWLIDEISCIATIPLAEMLPSGGGLFLEGVLQRGA